MSCQFDAYPAVPEVVVPDDFVERLCGDVSVFAAPEVLLKILLEVVFLASMSRFLMVRTTSFTSHLNGSAIRSTAKTMAASQVKVSEGEYIIIYVF